MDDETYDGYPNRETWQVSLLLNNDRDWQSYVHRCLRLIDWDTALAGQVILVDAGSIGRVKARYAGTVVRDALEALLHPDEDSKEVIRDGSLEHSLILILTERQYSAIKDIGSLWRVDWFHLGVEFLTALEET
jgi:hypothetical protein